MKKITFVLLLGLLLVSCTSKSNEIQKQNQEEQIQEEISEIGMPNPMHEYNTVSDINGIVGTHVVIPSSLPVSNAKYFTINEEIAEVIFSLDGHEWRLRGSKILDQDISGIHDSNNQFVQGEDFSVYLNDYYIDRLFTENYQYTIVMKEPNGFSEETYSNYVFQIEKVLKQASDPNGIAGNYADSTSQRASMEITKFDGLYDISISWPSSASEVTYFYISGTYDKGKITYGGEQIVVNQYDANGEEINVDSTATNNLGYFEIKDGKLYWTGASQEQCKECVFEKLPF